MNGSSQPLDAIGIIIVLILQVRDRGSEKLIHTSKVNNKRELRVGLEPSSLWLHSHTREHSEAFGEFYCGKIVRKTPAAHSSGFFLLFSLVPSPIAWAG